MQLFRGFQHKNLGDSYFCVILRSLDFMNWFLMRGKRHLSLQFALLCLQLVLHLLGVLRCRLVTRHLTFEAGHLRAKQTECDMTECDIFVGICLCVYLRNSSLAYVLFQRGDLLLRLHQFELQVTHLPVWISCEGISHLWLTGHIKWKNTSTPLACCAGLLTLEFYHVWFSAILQNFTIWILRSIPLGLLIQLGL